MSEKKQGRLIRENKPTKVKYDSKSSWWLRGQMWTYEHILESKFWQDLPDKIDKATLEQALKDAWGAEKAFAKSQGLSIALGYDVEEPTPKDVFCDRMTEEEAKA